MNRHRSSLVFNELTRGQAGRAYNWSLVDVRNRHSDHRRR